MNRTIFLLSYFDNLSLCVLSTSATAEIIFIGNAMPSSLNPVAGALTLNRLILKTI